MALYFCKKCGRIAQESYSQKQQICDCCNSIMHEVPIKYLDDDLDFMIKDKETEQLLIEELVKTSPEFDPYLFEHRNEILAKQSAEFNDKIAHGKAIIEEKSRVPQCPSCGSSNVSKIGTVGRAVSVGIFGLASSKIGKTHKCNNCGSTW